MRFVLQKSDNHFAMHFDKGGNSKVIPWKKASGCIMEKEETVPSIDAPSLHKIESIEPRQGWMPGVLATFSHGMTPSDSLERGSKTSTVRSSQYQESFNDKHWLHRPSSVNVVFFVNALCNMNPPASPISLSVFLVPLWLIQIKNLTPNGKHDHTRQIKLCECFVNLQRLAQCESSYISHKRPYGSCSCVSF